MGFRRGKSCIPRDRTQGLAALGFSHPTTLVDTWNRFHPKCLDSCVVLYAQDGRAPTEGPDALDGPPPITCEEGRLVPRSPYPNEVWARVARLIAAGYSPTEAGQKVGMHRTTIWGAWQEHTDFRYRTYWEYVSFVREARAKLRRHNALLAPSWTLPPDDEGRLDRPLPPIIPDDAGPLPNHGRETCERPWLGRGQSTRTHSCTHRCAPTAQHTPTYKPHYPLETRRQSASKPHCADSEIFEICTTMRHYGANATNTSHTNGLVAG